MTWLRTYRKWYFVKGPTYIILTRTNVWHCWCFSTLFKIIIPYSKFLISGKASYSCSSPCMCSCWGSCIYKWRGSHLLDFMGSIRHIIASSLFRLCDSLLMDRRSSCTRFYLIMVYHLYKAIIHNCWLCPEIFFCNFVKHECINHGRNISWLM